MIPFAAVVDEDAGATVVPLLFAAVGSGVLASKRAAKSLVEASWMERMGVEEESGDGASSPEYICSKKNHKCM